MIPDNERSPLLNEVTFKKNPFTNNGHCNIFLPKFRTEFNSEEIDKKMPKFNYYKRLGKQFIQQDSTDQLMEQQNSEKQFQNKIEPKQQSQHQKTQSTSKGVDQLTEKQIPQQTSNQAENTATSLGKLVKSIEQQYSTNKIPKLQSDNQSKMLGKSTVFQLSSQNIVSPTCSKMNYQPFTLKQKTNSQFQNELNPEIKNTLLREHNLLNENSSLVKQIYKLNDLNLLNVYPQNSQKQQGIFKIDFIYNDYHSRSTNPGYARNGYGSFFTK